MLASAPITADDGDDDDDDVPLAHVRASISTANNTNTTRTTSSLNATATPSSLNATTMPSSRKRKGKGDLDGASGKKISTLGVNFLQISQLAPWSESESDSTNEFTPHHSICDQPHPSPAVSLAYMYPPTATPSLTSYLPNQQVSSVPNTSSNIFPGSYP